MRRLTFLVLFISCFSEIACSNDCNSTNELLEKIKVIPFKAEAVDDAYYNEIMSRGVKFLPCLAEQIINTNRMHDPRKCPPFNNFVVGDLAYMLFIDISGLQFESLLPKEVREKFKNKGVYAYFDYVSTEKNRENLSANCLEWCENNGY